MSKTLSRTEALANGETTYFTGVPCIHGHVSERYCNSRQCYECVRLKRGYNSRRGSFGNPVKITPLWCAKNRDRANAIARRWKARNSATHAAYVAAYRAAKLQATPRWADLDAIRLIYEKAKAETAKTGVPHHVDHIFPLKSDWVCGLHVATNLRVVTGAQNMAKKNLRIELIHN